MRGIFLFLFTLTFSLSTIAQASVNQTDSQGRKTGKWLDYHPNGKKRYEGNFREGYEIGTFKFWNGTGQLVSELMYSQKGEYADAKIYYGNKLVRAEGRFHNKKKDGLWKFYSKSPHVLKKEESYKNGVKDGPWHIYFGNGKLASEIFWKDGKRNGPWNDFFENGNPHVEATFENGVLEGDYVVFFIGEIIAKEGEYVKGKMNGIWLIYDDKAQIIKKERYSNGFLQEEVFFTNGKLSSYKSYTRTKFNDDFKNGE